MDLQRGSSAAELPKVMKNWKTLVSTVLFPKWTFLLLLLLCTVWLVNRGAQKFKPVAPQPSMLHECPFQSWN